MKLYKKLINGWKWEIIKSDHTKNYSYYASIYDPSYTKFENKYKTEWCGGCTLQEAKDNALKFMSTMIAIHGANY